MTISTIAFILSTIVYLIPFIVKWAKGEKIYQTPKTKKEIPNKLVFLTKVGVLALMIGIYALLYPSKMMFYPPKTMVFIIVLIILQLVTEPIFCKKWLDEITDSEMFKEWAMYALILIVLLMVTGCSWGSSDKEIIKCPEYEETIAYYVKSINSSGLVIYDDENGLQTLSITDENVSVEPNDKADTYMEKTISYAQYRNKYDKNPNVVKGNMVEENYTVYISKKDWKRLMNK